MLAKRLLECRDVSPLEPVSLTDLYDRPSLCLIEKVVKEFLILGACGTEVFLDEPVGLLHMINIGDVGEKVVSRRPCNDRESPTETERCGDEPHPEAPEIRRRITHDLTAKAGGLI